MWGEAGRPPSSLCAWGCSFPTLSLASLSVTGSLTSHSKASQMSLVMCSMGRGEDLQVHPNVLGDCEGAGLYLFYPEGQNKDSSRDPSQYPQETPLLSRPNNNKAQKAGVESAEQNEICPRLEQRAEGRLQAAAARTDRWAGSKQEEQGKRRRHSRAGGQSETGNPAAQQGSGVSRCSAKHLATNVI